ncbi:hypothetical protein FRC11_003482, partial [Ceratobasidium sp. 423]
PLEIPYTLVSMAPLSPHISLAALAQVRDIDLPDPSKPNTYLVYCDFFLKKDGYLTIPVLRYFGKESPPPIGAYVFVDGPFWMLVDTDGSIEADIFEVVTESTKVPMKLPSPSVSAIGTVATIIGRDIHIDVGSYSRESKDMVTYQLIVTVPDNARRSNMKMPDPRSNIAVHGTLSYISVYEEFPAIELESLTYLPRTDFSRKDGPPSGGRTKRQLLAGTTSKAVDVGRPMKKTKSGPPEAFTPEELGAGSSSQASSSDASSPQASSSGTSSSQSGSSQSSVSSSPPPSLLAGGTARLTRSAKNSQ